MVGKRANSRESAGHAALVLIGWLVAVALFPAVAGAPKNDLADGPAGKLKVVTDTSSTALVQRLVDAFRTMAPSVSVSVATLGTAASTPWWRAEASGSVALLGDPMGTQERAAFRQGRSYEPVELPVGFDPLALIVHPDNPVDFLTPDALQRIFGPGERLLWEQFGVHGPLASVPVHPVIPDRSAPLHDYFLQEVLSPANYNVRAARRASTRAVMATVAGRPGAIGFIPLRRITGPVKTVPVAQTPDSAPQPADAAPVRTETYPYSRPVLFYADAPGPGRMSVEAAGFARFLCSQKAQSIMEEHGLVALASDQREKCLTQLPRAGAFEPGSGRRQSGPD